MTEVIWLETVDSTQDELLRRLAPGGLGLPDGGALASADQRAGRGRQGRTWTASPGTALALTVHLTPAAWRPPVGMQHFSWLSLVAASAVVDVVRDLGVPAHLKWPNDVLVEDGRKLCGVLAAVTPGGGVAIGMGVNVDHRAGAPVETATALSDWMDAADLPAPRALAERLHAAVLDRVRAWAVALPATGAPVDGTHGCVAAVVGHLSTLGRQVRAELPGGEVLEGEAIGLGPGGTLRVAPATGDHERMAVREISAGDVVHLRGDVRRAH